MRNTPANVIKSYTGYMMYDDYEDASVESLEDGVVNALRYMREISKGIHSDAPSEMASLEMQAALHCYNLAESRLLQAVAVFERSVAC